MKGWAIERNGKLMVETTHRLFRVVTLQVQMLRTLNRRDNLRAVPVIVTAAARAKRERTQKNPKQAPRPRGKRR